MCGIAGAWWPEGQPAESLEQTGLAMARSLRHRGPDALTAWSDPAAGLVLGHSRLAVIDLSAAGAQPMHSHSGRFVIAFNGEIYNHLEVRQRLLAGGHSPPWRGHSDTEALCAAIDAWGLEAALTACCGMFALALWDRNRRVLTLARDRLGERPLYYGRVGSGFGFASELRALRLLPDFDAAPDPEAVLALLAYQYIPDPLSIHPGIAKLQPGHLVEISAGQAGAPRPWWTVEQSALAARDHRRAGHGDSVGRLETVLGDVIGSQMLSDVPLGCFLSGGIDSSLIAAMMQARSSARIRTYAIGFADSAYDEAPHARAVAAHLGTDHTEAILREEDVLALVPEVHRRYDEPFADSSQLPTLLLARLARQDITVALTGDGGDEIFGGYPRYLSTPRVWDRLQGAPGPLVGAAALGGRAAAGLVNILIPLLGAAGLARRLPDNLPARLDRAARILRSRGDAAMFNTQFNRVASDARALLSADLRGELEVPAVRGMDPALLADLGMARWMMGNDLLGYLPGDILVKMDRAAMAASLEARAPLLDVRVLDFAWTIPDRELLAAGGGKGVLRRLLDRYVPRALVDRPKQGFAVPMDQWLRGPLRPWAEDLLAPAALARSALLDSHAVRRLWRRHLADESGLGQTLWAVLMLQAWALGDPDPA